MPKYVTTVNGTPTKRPTKKVLASGLAGVIVGIIIFLLETFIPDFPLTPDVAAALEVLVMAIVAYLTPPGASEGSKRIE